MFGDEAKKFFSNESGSHRYQRIPPTERKGRVHTSIITVAVLDKIINTRIIIDNDDLEIKACRGSGNGGQNRNKVSTAVQVKHIPSGIMVRCEETRSQLQNKQKAISMIEDLLNKDAATSESNKIAKSRLSQAGTGTRCEKSRTINIPGDYVINHNNNKRISYSEYRKGQIEKIH